MHRVVGSRGWATQILKHLTFLLCAKTSKDPYHPIVNNLILPVGFAETCLWDKESLSGMFCAKLLGNLQKILGQAMTATKSLWVAGYGQDLT